MKIALITDTHFGARNDSLPFNEYFYKFWENIFFPYIDKNNIKTIIHLGDTMDRRKFVSYKIANDFRTRFIQPLVDRNIDTHILIGNHDTYYKNTNEVNSLAELVGNKYNNIKFYEENCTVNFGNVPIFFCPWINAENYASTMKGIQSTNADVCMGHLEINGFEMHKGHYSESGYPKEMFKKFDTVFSGHFHKRQTQGNVTYIGNPFAHNYADAWDNDRGCMMLEWGSMKPKYMIWPAGPKYRTITLSKLLEAPDDYLEPETHVRVKIDIDITYEEANFIKENFQNTYSLREISLLPHKEIEDELEFQGEIKFQSVDEIVLEQLRSIESETFDNSVLVEIYNRL